MTFTAQIDGEFGGTPTGTVTFYDNLVDGTSTDLGSALLSADAGGAQAVSPPIAGLTAGQHTITAVYSGDAAFAGSTSAVLTQTVNWSTTGVGLVYTAMLGSFTDPNYDTVAGDYTVSVNWGDNSSTTGAIVDVGAEGLDDANGSTFAVTGSHTFQQAGTYNIQATVTDQSANTWIINSIVKVDPSGLNVNFGPLSAIAAAAYSGAVLTFTDPNGSYPSSEYSATINWGDGSSQDNAVINGDNINGFQVVGNHTYADEGDYSVTVALNTNFGLAASITNMAFALPGKVKPEVMPEGAFTALKTKGTYGAGYDIYIKDPKTNAVLATLSVTVPAPSKDLVLPAISATLTPESGTIANLAKQLGVDHFNAYQILEVVTDDKKSPIATVLLDKNGNAVGQTFVDSPPGGLYTKDDNGKLIMNQWTDNLPWYLDEQSAPNGTPANAWNTTYLASSAVSKDGTSFSFQDSPRITGRTVSLSFNTWLVGVDAQGKKVLWLPGYSWDSSSSSTGGVDSSTTTVDKPLKPINAKTEQALFTDLTKGFTG